jgi:hypothetical protein
MFLGAYPKRKRIVFQIASPCSPKIPPGLSVKRASRNSQPLNRAGCYSDFEIKCKSFLSRIKKFLHSSPAGRFWY